MTEDKGHNLFVPIAAKLLASVMPMLIILCYKCDDLTIM